MDSKAQLTVDIIAKVAERKITIVNACGSRILMQPWPGSSDGVPEPQETRRHARASQGAQADDPGNRLPMTDAFATDDSSPDRTIAAASDDVHSGR